MNSPGTADWSVGTALAREPIRRKSRVAAEQIRDCNDTKPTLFKKSLRLVPLGPASETAIREESAVITERNLPER